MSQFSTDVTTSLEKEIDQTIRAKKTIPERVNFVYEIKRCTDWIQQNQYKKTCLQFPDYLLPDATEVVKQFQTKLNGKVYILGDTAYESCCVDYVAAQHIDADSIIHFGRTCFSKTEQLLPCLIVYEKYDLNVPEFCTELKSSFPEGSNLLILIDTPYLYKIDELRIGLNDYNSIEFHSVQDDLQIISDSVVVYLGQNDKKLMNINLTYNPKELHYCDPELSIRFEKYEQDMRILKRRNYLIEHIRDANVIGIVISTLAVRNYLTIIERMKKLTKINRKKYYLISVGKATVAKLANFPEVNVFVVIGCALNDIYEVRDYYKPIATPHDMEMALNPNHKKVTQFTYEYNHYLQQQTAIDDLNETDLNDLKESDVSLLTGQVRCGGGGEGEMSTDLLEKSDASVQVASCSGAGYLASREWKGLQQKLGETEATLATEGRSGVAQSYENETALH